MKWFNREETRREELEDELRSHLAMSAREHATRGESESEYAARREFGSVTKISDDVQDTWRGARFEQLQQDLRYAVRGLLRSLGFTITVAVTFALGVGANGAVFAVIEPLLLRTPAGVPEAGQTHRVFHVAGTRAGTRSHCSAAWAYCWSPARWPGSSLPGGPHA